MDILAYEQLKQGLIEYNELKGKPRGNTILSKPPKNPSYPITILTEIRNIDNLIAERVSSVGYRVDIYAKTKGKIDNQTIAREIAYYVNEYLSSKRLKRVSFNVNLIENEDSICAITMTYAGNLEEYRRRFI